MARSRRRRVRFGYPAEFKQSLLRSLGAASAVEVARRHDIALTTLYRWRREAMRGHSEPSGRSRSVAASAAAIGEREPADTARSPSSRESQRAYRFDPERMRSGCAVLKRLEAAREFIEKRYFDYAGCDDLANRAGMSKAHFVRVYKQAFGESPHQHVLRRRAQAALDLLTVTLQPMKNVACAVGFDSTSSLARALRKFAPSGIPQYVYFG